MLKADIKVLIHELRHRFQERYQDIDPISWSTLLLHPEDFSDFLKGLSAIDFADLYRSDPYSYANVILRENALLPEGTAALCKYDSIIALINLEYGTIQLWDIPENEGKIRRK